MQGNTGAGSLSPASDTAYLRGGPVHYGVTPLPGAGEPFAVAGHRTTYSAPFYSLNALRQGDRDRRRHALRPVRLHGRPAHHRAAVATWRLFDRGYGLVLTTCTPPYSASHRLVVWATRPASRSSRGGGAGLALGAGGAASARVTAAAPAASPRAA